ncbi:MAG: hypothetical protein ACOH19_04930 [Rhodoglobus sp.]
MTTEFPQKIRELFDEIDRTMYGPEERALVNEAVALAVETGDEVIEYYARMRLTASAKQTGDTDTMLSSFAWCLGKYDSDPTRFPADIDNGSADLLWQYKWMAGTLGATPIFGRDEIDAVLDDMRVHYERAGLGMSGVYTAQFEDAWSNGRIEEADGLRVKIAETPRDEHSHCDACGRSQLSGFLAELGREAEAITLVEEMIEGGFSCGDEPEFALSRTLIPYLRAGRLDDAKNAHLRSYRLSKDNPDKISIIANHLIFCAITGNEARGLAMLERHIGWLAHDGLNVSGQFDALVSFGVMLDAVTSAGHGDATVRGADSAELTSFFGEHDGPWTAGELAVAAWGAASRIGAAFDERNGNGYHAELIARAHALSTERYDVPINTDTFAPVATVVAEPTDAAGWHERARELANLGEAVTGVAAARRAIELTTGRERDGAYSLLIGGLVRLEEWAEAEKALVERGTSLRESGRDAQADLEQRRGLALYGRSTAEDRAGLEEELASSDALPGDVVADLQLTLASLLMLDDEPDLARVGEYLKGAVENFDTPETQLSLASALSFQCQFEASMGDPALARTAVDRLIALAPDRATLANAYVLSARLRGADGDHEAGARDADEATRLFSALDARGNILTAANLAAALLGDADRHDEAIGRLRFAVQQSQLLEGSHTGLRFQYGRALVRGGSPAEATEILGQVFDDETSEGTPPESRAETLYWLGHAHTGNEQHGNAVGTWNSAVQLYLEGGDSQGAAKAGTAAGRLLSRFGENEDALEALDDAASEARKTPENVGLLTDVLHALGTAQANSGSDTGLATLDEVAALAEQYDAQWLLADVTDSKARALHSLGRSDEAIQLGLVAADRYAEAGDPWSAGGAELLVARLLSEAGRAADAVAIYRSTIEHAEGNSRLVSIAALELGDVLEGLGRTDEAAQARALAEE